MTQLVEFSLLGFNFAFSLNVWKSKSVYLCMGLVGGYSTYRLVKRLVVLDRVRQAAHRHQQRLLSSEQALRDQIQLYRNQSGETVGIGQMDWEELHCGLSTGRIRAVDTVLAYQEQSMAVHGKTNCVVAWLLDACATAQELDLLPENERGPLHGIPLDVKESFFVSNTDSTGGLLKFFEKPAERDSPAVMLLKSLGAVPITKSNVSQGLSSLQCSNPIFGQSSNVVRPDRECGGSGGGQASLVRGGGALLGLGADIAGSLRNPAAFCGIYSLKPTPGRHVSVSGCLSGSGGNCAGLPTVGGFTSSSAQLLTHVWRHVWNLPRADNPTRFDATVVPASFDEESFGMAETLPTVGYYLSDDLLQPCPASQRAVEEAVSILAGRGFATVEFPSPPMRKVVELFAGLVLADKNRGLNRRLSWDVTDSCLRGLVTALAVYKVPYIVREFVLYPVYRRLTSLPAVSRVCSDVEDLQKALLEKDELAAEYLALMESRGVDVILTPGQLTPAPKVGVMGRFPGGLLPYVPWNVLNFPAGIAPITTYTKEDNEMMKKFPDNDIVYREYRKVALDAEGLPLAVQVVGKPHKDEQVLRILTIFEEYNT